MFLEFPQNFLWGASTSAHQIEGHNINQWTEWEKRQAPKLASKARAKYEIFQVPDWEKVRAEAQRPENYISGKAANFLHTYPEDISLAKELNLNTFRFSLEWSRIEPQEGYFDKKALDYYHDLLRLLRANNIEPMVTLWHWTVPLWFYQAGDWTQKSQIAKFVKFAAKMAEEFPEVNYWLTLNEPEVYAWMSYLLGYWPPQKKSLNLLWLVGQNLITAHRQAYAAVKEISPHAKVSLAKSNTYFEARPPHFVNRALKHWADYWGNFYILDKTRSCLDFIGLNYYFHNRINWRFNRNPNQKLSDLGWELYPEGLYHVLKDLKKYNLPVIITEHGLADRDDRYRSWYIRESLRSAHQALSEGVDLRGYLHWSLLDNFEWNKGFWPRFGLVEVHYQNFKRRPRASAQVLAQIAAANGLEV